MTKLVVEVLDACDLMHKDRHGSASPFVEVVFEGQRQRTRTKAKDLNPVWNEKLVFNVSDPEDLHNKTTDIVVYNDQKDDHHKNFLGRVRISGLYIPLSENEAAVQRYPLDKRGMFSNIRGDIALKIYAVHDSSYSSAPQSGGTDSFENPLQEQHNKLDEDKISDKKKKKEKEVRSFHSIGTATSAPAPKPTSFSGFGFEEKKENPVNVETRSDFAQAGQPTVMHLQVARQNSECELVETSPQIAARLRYKGGDKTSSTYDLVELMYYLYVNVVKARDLPTMDVTGSLDPYVEVKLGNYRGITRHFEKNQNPVWKQIFAFSKERLQSHLLEVTVKDKDIGKDDFVGRVLFDLSEVPFRVPPDSPLAPQWYKLVDKKGDKTKGELMLAVWIGTQADECFPQAWHSDAHDVNQENLANTRSKVYFSPKLCYLRIHVIEAQDLVPYEKSHVPQAYVKMQLGNQMKFTQPFASVRPVWNDELMFVASELDEFIIIKVEDRSKDQTLGTLTLPVSVATPRMESSKLVDSRWFNLEKPSSSTEASGGEKKESKFSSKIHLRLCLDAGYHVLDESTHYSSDLQPPAKHLRKPSIGILELGILNARNLLPMKTDAGRTDAYCVAKYGNKWVRSRTLMNTMAPRWNEQYTWQVHDPCTVITIGVFDNCHINGSKEGSKDQRIGKVRIRLSTLEANRVYTHYYPLLVLHPSGLKKTGELHLAVRFTCTAWVNMVSLYGKPMLPKMHYVQPIPVRYIDLLRHHATQIVAARLARAEPPLRKETVEYMLDVHSHIWSARKSKANFNRMMLVFSGLMAVCKWFNDICNWKNPITTILVHVLFLILVCYPELILPTVFLYLFVIGIWNFRFRPRHPPHIDAKLSFAKFVPPDELDEEFDQFPSSRPPDVVRRRYDRLRSLAGRVQTVLGDLATQGERAHSLLSWRDPRATAIFIIFSLILAVFLYVTPFQVVAVLVGLYLLRHPRFRSKLPPVPVNFYKRLPAKSEMLL